LSLLEVQDVTVRFGGHTALSDVSLNVDAGRITGLIGPNGAGKTTMFNVITGLLHPTRGKVVLDGRDIGGKLPYKRARLGMARTFQRLELFGQLTVRENIQVAGGLRKQWGRKIGGSSEGKPPTVDELLDRVGLASVAEVRADALPTGQGRLIELARALAIRPRVLLLDEPASGQDEEETKVFSALLRSLADEGMAILLVEHDMELVMQVCSHLYVLDFGQLMAAGDPEVVRNDPKVQAAYLGTAKEVAA
jgi:branched-chain amino acid transport system ATP-binding protein